MDIKEQYKSTLGTPMLIINESKEVENALSFFNAMGIDTKWNEALNCFVFNNVNVVRWTIENEEKFKEVPESDDCFFRQATILSFSDTHMFVREYMLNEPSVERRIKFLNSNNIKTKVLTENITLSYYTVNDFYQKNKMLFLGKDDSDGQGSMNSIFENRRGHMKIKTSDFPIKDMLAVFRALKMDVSYRAERLAFDIKGPYKLEWTSKTRSLSSRHQIPKMCIAKRIKYTDTHKEEHLEVYVTREDAVLRKQELYVIDKEDQSIIGSPFVYASTNYELKVESAFAFYQRIKDIFGSTDDALGTGAMNSLFEDVTFEEQSRILHSIGIEVHQDAGKNSQDVIHVYYPLVQIRVYSDIYDAKDIPFPELKHGVFDIKTKSMDGLTSYLYFNKEEALLDWEPLAQDLASRNVVFRTEYEVGSMSSNVNILKSEFDNYASLVETHKITTMTKKNLGWFIKKIFEDENLDNVVPQSLLFENESSWRDEYPIRMSLTDLEHGLTGLGFDVQKSSVFSGSMSILNSPFWTIKIYDEDFEKIEDPNALDFPNGILMTETKNQWTILYASEDEARDDWETMIDQIYPRDTRNKLRTEKIKPPKKGELLEFDLTYIAQMSELGTVLLSHKFLQWIFDKFSEGSDVDGLIAQGLLLEKGSIKGSLGV